MIERVYSAHLALWVRVLVYNSAAGYAIGIVETPGRTYYAAADIPIVGLFTSEHYPAQIGTRNEDGSRTHTPPGEVCAECSNPAEGLWVPVNTCPISWAIYQAERERNGYGAHLWLT